MPSEKPNLLQFIRVFFTLTKTEVEVLLGVAAARSLSTLMVMTDAKPATRFRMVMRTRAEEGTENRRESR